VDAEAYAHVSKLSMKVETLSRGLKKGKDREAVIRIAMWESTNIQEIFLTN
jgi:hypothetical protein